MKRTYTSLICAFLLVGLWSCTKNNPETPPQNSNKKSFFTFAFKVIHNPAIKEDILCSIGNDTIYTHALSGIPLSSLIPDFTFEGKSVTLNKIPQISGETAQDFNSPLTYFITAEDGSTKSYVVIFEVDIPTLQINTNNVPVDSKEEYVNGTLKITGNIPPSFSYDGKMKIKGRGNSTWGMAKKPFKIKLEVESPLLGMNSDKTWVLLANYADKTMMRNAIGFELSRRLDLAFTPESQFVDLMLNNQYQGTYQLVEQVEVAPHKINIEKQDKNATALPQIAGGYLLEVDGFASNEPLYFYTPKRMPITVHYPDAEEISSEQVTYITQYVNDFEKALFADDFSDPVNGYRKYFDVDAYINYYLVNEIIGNSDVFWSTYLYKTRNGKIQAGPVWDFDIAGNNDNRLGDAVHKLMFDKAHEPKTWINRLMEDASFRKQVRKRWNEIKTTKVNTIPLYVDELSRKLRVTQKQNFNKWDIFNITVYRELELPGSFQGEVNYLRRFLESRIKWLDSTFQGPRFN